MSTPSFIFVTCQVGAEPAVKAELARKWPAFRFAFSRPGFLTFKIPPGAALADDFDLHSVFARAYGFSLGKATGDSLEVRAKAAAQIAEDHVEHPKFDCMHAWQRDLYEPGHRGYEPGLTELAIEAQSALQTACGLAGETFSASTAQDDGEHKVALHPHPDPLPSRERERTSAEALVAIANSPTTQTRFEPTHSAQPGQLVLDCVIVEPNEWWIGYHRAASIPSRWPGGLFTMPFPDNAVSRAYLKMEEALAWSRMPLRKADVWAEIGSAPGGASQALLNHGLKVIGIDPADMESVVIANPNFTHIKMRGANVRRREFRGVNYLAADINVAPNYTLETVEHIVTHPEVRIQGLLLTLKLLDWKLAEQLPEYLDRIRSWGYSHVRARQLHHNRQEVCVSVKR